MKKKTFRTAAYRIVAVDEHCIEPLRTWLDSLYRRDLGAWPDCIVRTTRERCFMLRLDDSVDRYFCKVFSPRHGLGFLAGFGIGSKGMRGFNRSIHLSRVGIPTPRPLAFAGITAGPNKGYTLMMTEWLDTVSPLGPFMDKFLKAEHDSSWVRKRRQITILCSQLLKALHRAGIFHGDLTINNILIHDEEPMTLYIIDTADIRSIHRISGKKILRNLSEANRFFLDANYINRSDRIRFLINYLGSERPGRAEFRRLWKEIDAHSHKELAKQGRFFF